MRRHQPQNPRAGRLAQIAALTGAERKPVPRPTDRTLHDLTSVTAAPAAPRAMSGRRQPAASVLPWCGLALLFLASAPRQALGFDWRYENQGRSIVRSLGKNNNKAAKEISGVVASRTQTETNGNETHGGVLWSHNDSGNGPYLFALNASTGEHIAWFELQGDNLPNSDWEDIAIGPGPVFGQDYICTGTWAAPGGPTRSSGSLSPSCHTTTSLPRGLRPHPAEPHRPIPLTRGSWSPITNFEVIQFRYPSGKSHDCEVLTVDPITGDIFVAAKHNNRLDVYVLHYGDVVLDATNELRLHYSSCNDPRRTGTHECEHCDGCVSSIADGNTIVAADILAQRLRPDYVRLQAGLLLEEGTPERVLLRARSSPAAYMNRHGTEEALACPRTARGTSWCPRLLPRAFLLSL